MIYNYTLIDNKNRSLITFSLNKNDKLYNQTLKSLNAFSKRITENAELNMRVVPESELQNIEMLEPNTFYEYNRKYVNTLWMMYEEINYDYKKQKFIS